MPEDLWRRTLQSYVEIAVLRDIAERNGITNLPALHFLVRRLLRSVGSPFSAHGLFQELKSQKLAAGKDTVYEYLQHIEDSYLLLTLPLCTDSERRRQMNPRKVYAVDHGLVRANTPSHILDTAPPHAHCSETAGADYDSIEAPRVGRRSSLGPSPDDARRYQRASPWTSRPSCERGAPLVARNAVRSYSSTRSVTPMGATQYRTLIVVFVALTVLGWTLRPMRSFEGDGSLVLSPVDGTVTRPESEPEVHELDLAPSRGAVRDAVELDDLAAGAPTEEQAARNVVISDQSAPGIWEAEYAEFTLQQLDQERRDLLGDVSRLKHAIGFEKLNAGEGAIMARGAKPDEEAYAIAPGTMSVFRGSPDSTAGTLWERVDLLPGDHPELFELDAKMRWVNQEWARRSDATGGFRAGPLGPR